MAYQPKNPNGQATMANSEPVVISSDQSAVPVSGTVELGATSLAALENISVTVPGTIDLGTVSLTALETITVEDGGGSLTVDGSVNATLASETTKVIGTVNQGTSPWVISGTVTATTGGLTDTQLRATAVPVSGTFWQATQPVSIASMPATPVTDNSGSLTVDAPVATPVFVRLSDGASAITTLPVSFTGSTDVATQTTLSALNAKVTNCNTGAVTISAALPAGANTIGAINIAAAQTLATVTTVGTVTTCSTVTNLSQVGGVAVALGAGTSSTGTRRVIEASAATGTQSNPSLSTASATLLASNTSRRGASVFNGSALVCYVRLSATAATSSVYSIMLNPGDYYEVPGNYNGAITAILASSTTTLVQVTEIT